MNVNVPIQHARVGDAQLLGVEDHDDAYVASVEFSGMSREHAAGGPSPFREVWNGDLADIRRRTRTRAVASFTGALRGACAHCPAFNLVETGDEERESDYMKRTTLLRYQAAMSRQDGECP